MSLTVTNTGRPLSYGGIFFTGNRIPLHKFWGCKLINILSAPSFSKSVFAGSPGYLQIFYLSLATTLISWTLNRTHGILYHEDCTPSHHETIISSHVESVDSTARFVWNSMSGIIILSRGCVSGLNVSIRFIVKKIGYKKMYGPWNILKFVCNISHLIHFTLQLLLILSFFKWLTKTLQRH